MKSNRYLRKLKNIYSKNGNIRKFLRVDKNTKKIDEIYFSEIKFLKIKCWKKHIENNLRIYVIKGQIRFIIIKNKELIKVDLKELSNNYIYIPKKTIFGFQGIKRENLLLCSLEKKHYDSEVINYTKEKFQCNLWKK